MCAAEVVPVRTAACVRSSQSSRRSCARKVLAPESSARALVTRESGMSEKTSSTPSGAGKSVAGSTEEAGAAPGSDALHTASSCDMLAVIQVSKPRTGR